jgi:DNA modification methylase
MQQRSVRGAAIAWPPAASPRRVFSTHAGASYRGLAEDVLLRDLAQYKGKVSLILTSPPFPLNRKKRYGNLTGEEYRKWLATFALIFRDFLKPRGSIVMEIGNAWEPGQPSMSTLGLEALIDFRNAGRLTLCQQFVWYNPTKLPTPVQWVNITRTRVKDSFTHIWWMAKSHNPVANNRRVLVEYSDSMKNLLARQSYNSGLRPSQHNIGDKSFLKDNGGAIPSNVLTISNSIGTDKYQAYCRMQRVKPHPARMPSALPEFFINFLTRPGDIVLDPFAGSNTTGAAAQALGRKWLAIEADEIYIKGSRGRFE